MLPLRQWLDRLTDRRPVIQASRSRRRRSGRPWLLLGLLLALLAMIALLLARHSPAQADTTVPSVAVACAFIADSNEQPDSP